MLETQEPKLDCKLCCFDESDICSCRECADCGCAYPVLFCFGGDTTERCAACHNSSRYVPAWDDEELSDSFFDY